MGEEATVPLIEITRFEYQAAIGGSRPRTVRGGSG